MANNEDQQPVALNRSFPRNHVIGAIDALQEAEQAVEALKNAGYRAEDILLVPSQTFINDFQKIRQNTNPVRQALHTFFTSSDEGFPGDLYLEQARRGSQVLHVYASTEEQARGIAQLLSRYHAHLLRYFGPLTVTEFALSGTP